MATDKQQLETLLDDVRGKLCTIREELDDYDDYDDIPVSDVAPLLKSLHETAIKAEEQADEAYSLWEDFDHFSEEDLEHVLRALKHLGISGIDALTSSAIRMSMEQVYGL